MAFVTPFGKHEFNMVPFGLAQAPAYFQALINKVLKGLHKFAAYLDDIIIFSKNWMTSSYSAKMKKNTWST